MVIGNHCMSLPVFDVKVITVTPPFQVVITRLVASLVHILFLFYDWSRPEMAQFRGQTQLLVFVGSYFLFLVMVHYLFSDGPGCSYDR